MKNNKLIPGCGKLLISEPALRDFYFNRSVVLLTEHNETEGTIGLILNKPIHLNLNEVVKEFPKNNFPLFLGGPVHPERLFYLHTLGDKVPGSIEVIKGLYWGGEIQKLMELIEFNLADSISLRYHNQVYLEMAQEKGDLNSPEYKEALAQMHKGSRDQGIDRVMDKHNLDAIIAPTGSPAWKTDLINGDSFQLGSSSPAAHAGYPNISLPMGFIDGLPVGISFFGRAWSEPVLIEIAYAYEAATKHRRKPEFLKTDK